MWEITIAFGSIMTASLGVIITYLTLHEKKKQQRIKEYRVKMEEKDRNNDMKLDLVLRDFRESLKQDMEDCIFEHIKYEHADLINKECSEEEHSKIWKQLLRVEQELKEHYSQSVESEIIKLGHDIVNYADDLRLERLKSRASYKNIAHCYDRYKRLGGNHFIDGEFAYIKKRMEELDNE